MHLAAVLLTAIASWYGPGLYGNNMACGSRLSTQTFGVANKSLPCGTKLVICYKRCRIVRVVDRGPFISGRTFDLTNPVRVAIGAPYGVFTVRYRVLGR